MVKPAGGSERALSWGALAAFLGLSLPLGMMQNTVVAILPSFYAKETQATLATIGAILMLTRILDAALDPVIGAWSDRTRLAMGRRKPWILAGGLLGVVSFYWLFTPDPTATGVYFALWSILFYVAYTFMHIPYQAWAAELSRDYAERARIFGYLAIMNISGLLIFNAVPLSLPHFLPSRFPTSYFSRDMLEVLAWLFIVVCALATVTITAFVPDRTRLGGPQTSLRDLVKSISGNGPFFRFAAIYGISGFGWGLYYGTSYIYIDSFLKIGDKFPVYLITVAVTQAMTMPLWVWLIPKIGKIPIWFGGWLVYASILPLRLFVEPGESAFYAILALVIVSAIANSSSSVIAPSVLGDVVDYDTLRSGQNRAGNYYAFLILIQKINVAVGGGVALMLLGLFGYDPKLETNSAFATDGMLFVVCVLPSVFFLISTAFIYRFPIDRRRHGIIKRRIETRAARLLAANPTMN